MARWENVLKSWASVAVGNKVNHATLDACIEQLHGVELCKEGESTPLTEAAIRRLNPDLGTLHFNDDLETICLSKFQKHAGIVPCHEPAELILVVDYNTHITEL